MAYPPFRLSEQMILIGALGRNSGKTTLAVALIRRWKSHFPITALKITTVDHKNGLCPRGGHGCGACSEFTGNYQLEEITICSVDAGKDTDILLSAGAHKVFWIRSFRANLAEAFTAFLEKMQANSLLICESNSLARLLLDSKSTLNTGQTFRNAACFVMLAHSKDNTQEKPGTRELLTQSDLLLQGNYTVADIAGIAGKIKIEQGEYGTPRVYRIG